jgi:molecular chaperone HscB
MATTAVVRCWRCQDEHTPQVFCPACEALQPLPPDIDYFTLFGLARDPLLDEQALAGTYYDLSRQLHPDLHQTGPAEEQEASLQNTALVNRAYRTLRDPVQRGRYWLELNGEQLGKENNKVPPALALLVFEVQEKLAAVREARPAETDAAQDTLAGLKAELTQVRDDLDDRMRDLQHRLAANFSKWAQAGSAQLLGELKRVLSDMAYLRTLTRDVEKALSTL